MTAARREGVMGEVKTVTSLQVKNARSHWSAPVDTIVRRRCNACNFFNQSREPQAQYFRRMLLGRILSSVRYFATVRRAIGIPRLLKILTISLSLSGALPSSFFTRSRMASFTLVLLIDSPVAVW